jgi:iron complex outermembrane receptor protein
LALALCALGCTAHAQPTPTELDKVAVSGSGIERRAFETPYAVSVVDAAELRSAGPMVNLSESLSRVPGIVANLRNN